MSTASAGTDLELDVLIVGAGLSGIGAACQLSQHCPKERYLILEAREAMGGTWDLFRYPGVRSDSDMYTLGYSFAPWKDPKAIADGPSILRYIRDTAARFGVEQHIRYRQTVTRANWCSDSARWTVQVSGPTPDQTRSYRCRFLYMCSGYYNYAQGYTPEFAGADDFSGQIVHPQHWPENLDYRGKKVVVIGSGATAVTLVPTLAEGGAQVTMLQRSPSYIMSLPEQDPIADRLRRWLPARLAHALVRGKNVILGGLFFAYCRRYARSASRWLRREVAAQLPSDFDVRRHFTPSYQPWDQRLCLVPNGDLFRALRHQQAQIVTDHIERFTSTGLQLRGGDHLDADIVVTATGLQLLACGGMAMSVDGRPVKLAQTMTYKGMMLSDVPNFAIATGYTNASWTLKCDLTSAYVCRLLKHLRRHGHDQCTPRLRDATVTPLPFIDFSSGYVQRAIDDFPRQGNKAPWRLYQNYPLDLLSLKFGRLCDGAMEFSAANSAAGPSSVPRLPAESATR